MNQSDKGFFAGLVGLGFFVVLANVAIWGTLIYFAFWCAHHFGLIG